MYLKPHADKPASSFSGGNKRKLCLAIALCGLPEVCVLDEPSAGVDTKSRADLWGILKAMRVPRPKRASYARPHDEERVTPQPQTESTTLMLTTHFMDEADELASRIAIMVKGQLTCLGTPQRLKSLYASHYLLTFQMQPRAAPQLEQTLHRLLGLFEGSSVNEEQSGGNLSR